MPSKFVSCLQPATRLLLCLIFSLLTFTPSTHAHELSNRDTTHPRIHTQLLELARTLEDEDPQLATTDQASNLIQLSAAGEIGVEVHVRGTTADAASALEQQGIRVNAWSAAFPLVGAWVHPEQLDALAALPMVDYIDPMLTPVTRAGSITSAGDDILRAAEARATFGLSGAGVRIGIISDGVSGLDDAQSLGELPPTCPNPLPAEAPSCVLIDPTNQGFGNEGRAMLEIIHDLAPGATLGFSSGVSGVTGFVAAIDYLQNDFRADVIVDDIGYLSEPFFENGTIGTRAQQAVDGGVVFVSAAGNDANRHYQAPLAAPSDCPDDAIRQCLHRFAANDTSQSFTLQNGSTMQVYLQWDNPFNDATDDLDVYLLEGTEVLAESSDDQLVTNRPLEIASYTNNSGAAQQVDVVIDAFALRSGTNPTIEMLFIAQDDPEYLTSADSIFGHPGMPGVLGIGAVDVPDAGPFLIRDYSSQGPVTISYPTPEVRPKPDLVATDCVATSAPGFRIFCGTSAAAPHIAALAALLLENEPNATPSMIRTFLTDSAVDGGAVGFDTIYGDGLADAVEAVSVSIDNPPQRTLLPLIVR